MCHMPIVIINRVVICVIIFLIGLAWAVVPAFAQALWSSSAYSFISDSDGGKAGKGSIVTITFTPP
jgi:hypothetical protein